MCPQCTPRREPRRSHHSTTDPALAAQRTAQPFFVYLRPAGKGMRPTPCGTPSGNRLSIDILVDLRGRFGSARNQRARPTCMAFAGSDAHSFAQGTTDYLSAEYAHYGASRRRSPIDPHRGVPMSLMIDAIREDGQPKEEGWPYLDAIPSPVSACRRRIAGRFFVMRSLTGQQTFRMCSRRSMRGNQLYSPQDQRAVLPAGLRFPYQDDAQ